MDISRLSRTLELTNTTHNSSAFYLNVIQQPAVGKAISKPQSARGTKWPIEPPPVVELVTRGHDPSRRPYLHSPLWFCKAELEPVSGSRSTVARADNLTGMLVSSLHKVKDQKGGEHGYFIFGDLNAQTSGQYKIKFTLFEMQTDGAAYYAARLHSTYTNEFMVHPSKQMIPVKESTALSKLLCESGVKLRIRKESSKRKPMSHDWSSDRMHAVNWRGPAMLPPPAGSMLPPSVAYQATHHGHRALGEDISDRLNVKGQSFMPPLAFPHDRLSMGPPSSNILPPPTNDARNNGSSWNTNSNIGTSLGHFQPPIGAFSGTQDRSEIKNELGYNSDNTGREISLMTNDAHARNDVGSIFGFEHGSIYSGNQGPLDRFARGSTDMTSEPEQLAGINSYENPQRQDQAYDPYTARPINRDHDIQLHSQYYQQDGSGQGIGMQYSHLPYATFPTTMPSTTF